MAIETLNPVLPTARPGEALAAVLGAHEQHMFDAVDLLLAVEDRIEAASSVDAADPLHATLRLTQMARERVKAAADAICQANGG